MAYAKELERRIDAIAGHAGFVKKKMFGGLGYLLQGHMCFGIHQDYLIVRLGSAEAAKPYLGQDHVRPLDITGRPMKGWIMAAPPAYAESAHLRAWLERGAKVARGLPSK
jgi:hypothetical protein